MLNSLGPFLLGFAACVLTLAPRSIELPAQDKKLEEKKGDKKGKGGPPGLIKPKMEDTVKANVYADNWFVLYINLSFP